MKIKLKETNIKIDESIFLVFLLCVLFEKTRNYFENYFVCFLFIIFHELAHISVASLLGIKLLALNINLSGLNAILNNAKTNIIKNLCIFSAGPISNVILAILFKYIPIVFNINIALAIINLLPIYPLDGYNIIKIIMDMFKINKKKRGKIQTALEIMVIVLLITVGIIQFVFLKNISVILMAFYIFIQSSNHRKNSNETIYQKYYKNITKF